METRSLRYIYGEASAAVRRFPLATAFCAAACVAAWRLAGLPEPQPHLHLTLLMTLSFGAALFYALALVNERFPLPAPARPRHLLAAGGLFLVFFYFRFAGAEGLEFGDRLAQWVFVVIMLAACAPFLRYREPLGLWQFNRRLVVGYAVSAVSTVVLFAGISLALAAVDKLLGLKVEDLAYQRLWILAGFLFWPLHFMAATPARPGELASDASYPRGLKLFTQYVLLPLASVYFLILYAYMAKILVTQQWPQGWVSWLTSSASALGLLAFLLLYPAAEAEENRWYRAFSRGFCAAALPLLAMLFVAVYKRVAQYGLTEHRYFLICLGLWLAGMFLYFLLSRRPDIRRVPMTLAALALITSVGPWGAYSVGLASQSARLQRLLGENGLLAGGKVLKLERPLPPEARQQLSGALDYILRYHGAAPLEKYFPSGHPALAGGRYAQGRTRQASKDLMSYMGQEYVNHWAQGGATSLHVRADRSGMDISGYGLAVRFYALASKPPVQPGETGYHVQLRREEHGLRVFKDGKFLIDVPLGPLLEKAAAAGRSEERVEQGLLKAEAANGAAKARVYLSGLSMERKTPGAPEPRSAEGLLLIRENSPGARR